MQSFYTTRLKGFYHNGCSDHIGLVAEILRTFPRHMKALYDRQADRRDDLDVIPALCYFE